MGLCSLPRSAEQQAYVEPGALAQVFRRVGKVIYLDPTVRRRSRASLSLLDWDHQQKPG